MEPAEPLFATKSDAGRETLSAGEGLMLDFIILKDLTTQKQFGNLQMVKMDQKHH